MRKIIEAHTTSIYKYYGVILTLIGYFIAIHLFQFFPLGTAIIALISLAIFVHSHFFSLSISFEHLTLSVGKIKLLQINLEDIKDLDNVNIRECTFSDAEFQIFSFRVIDRDMKAYTIRSCFLSPREVYFIIKLINHYTLGRPSKMAKLEIK